MAGNSIGQIFRITTFGESHGAGIGVVVDGCPAGLMISAAEIQLDLDRRKPGQSRITTQRKESDQVQILSGVFEGVTQGTPIALFIPNEDARSKDYDHLKESFRPSHADFTYEVKYGLRDHRGGGRSSARATAAVVAAGAVARKLLAAEGIQIAAFVTAAGKIQCGDFNRQLLEKPGTLRMSELIAEAESNMVRCPIPEVREEMIRHIDAARKAGDSLGGVVTCIISNCPAGLGEPLFDKLQADLAKAMFSINAVHGFEYGSGFGGATMSGSEHNDEFYADRQGTDSAPVVKTKTNFSGGIQGGISNGMEVFFNVAFKPVATIVASQESVNKQGDAVQVKGRGRHDPCVVPRAVPIVEAMAAITLADHYLRNRLARV